MLKITIPILFLIILGCDIKPMSNPEILNKVQSCLDSKRKPWYTFKQQGNKESGVMFIECVPKDYNPSTQIASLDEGDSTVGVPGFGQVTGIPGSPF